MQYDVSVARSVRRRLSDVHVVCSGAKSVACAHGASELEAALPFLILPPLGFRSVVGLVVVFEWEL
jgi:hypothetical protein